MAMKHFRWICCLFLLLTQATGFAQDAERFFDAKQLNSVGAYYYPEHWERSQWDRDLKKMAEMGFEITHFAEFAWAQLEPEEGRYDFEWLDEAVATAAKYGIKVILCTSTATPPIWLTRSHPEILILREDGTRWDHGARQHPSYSSTFYREYAMKMIAELGKRYGNDKRVIGWQLDNEPKVDQDFNDDAQQRFRTWVRNRYKTIDALNKAWGTAFWSQIYQNFDQINIPRGSQLFMNNHQRLDYRRFCAEETATFLDEQARTLRKYISRNQFITTNYIPSYDDGHLNASKELDFCTYTRYMVYGENYGIGRKGYRVGPMDRIAMANDFFRPFNGTYGVMELQPGQVNWGPLNSQPLPGAVHMYLWHVFAGGSKFTVTYRFRQPIYGTELYHYGIIGPDGVTPTPGGLEFQQYIRELKLLRDAYDAKKADLPEDYARRRTAMLFNPENSWSIELGRQTTEWNTEGHILKYFRALKSFGAPVDFIAEDQDFNAYRVMIAPAYQQVDDALIARWKAYAEQGGHLILTCRSGHKNRNGQLFEAKFGEKIYGLIGGQIDFFDLLQPSTPDQILFEGNAYDWVSWGEILQPDSGTEVWATYQGDFYAGRAAVLHHKLGKGTVTYIGVDSLEGAFEQAVLRTLYTKLGIDILDLPAGVTIEHRDGFAIALNYSDKPYTVPIPPDAKILVGQPTLETTGVVVWKD